jgi:hypothetical protein
MGNDDQSIDIQALSDATVEETTLEGQQDTTPLSNEGNVGQEEVAEPTLSEGTADNVVEDDDARRREQGKISKLERELNEARDAQKRYQNLVGWIQKDKDIYQRALVETGGYTQAEAKAETDRLYAQPQVQSTAIQSQQSPLNPRDVVMQIRVEDAVDNFDRTYTDITVDEREETMTLASYYMRKGSRPDEALKLAADKVIGSKTAKAEGVLEGKAQSLAVTAARKSGAIGKMPTGQVQTSYTPTQDDVNVRQELAMSDAEWQTYLKRQAKSAGLE